MWDNSQWDQLEWGGTFQISARIFLNEKTVDLGLVQQRVYPFGLIQEKTVTV